MRQSAGAVGDGGKGEMPLRAGRPHRSSYLSSRKHAGIDMKIFPFFSNHMPGAVPLLFWMTVQVWALGLQQVALIIGRLSTLEKIYFTLARAPSSRQLASEIFGPEEVVISSAVGPRPR